MVKAGFIWCKLEVFFGGGAGGGAGGRKGVIFFFLCAAPGFSQFLVIDFAPVFKGLVLALELLVS